MYIEELIHRLASDGAFLFADQIKLDAADATIISSLSNQSQFSGNASLSPAGLSFVGVMKPISAGIGLTEKQRYLAIKFVRKYNSQLSAALGFDITPHINNPKFKLEARKLIEEKRITVVASEGKKDIHVKFPFNEEITNEFREFRKTLPVFLSNDIGWSGSDRAWIFSYSEQNILLLSGLLDAGFTADDQFIKVAEEIKEIADNMEHYVPTVVYNNGKFEYKNASTNIPEPTSDNLIEVLVEARKYGITCWDEAISLALNEIDPAIKSFLNNAATDPTTAPGLLNVADIIRFSGTTLFVIPGGTELDHVKSIHSFLLKEGYSSKEMAVMFRLDSGAGTVCNEYIKNNSLNNVLSDSIRFVFVSGKIPKPLIASKKKIDIVIQFGLNSAHYTLKQYIRSHHNVISMNLV